jgi:hypothetical protein
MSAGGETAALLCDDRGESPGTYERVHEGGGSAGPKPDGAGAAIRGPFSPTVSMQRFGDRSFTHVHARRRAGAGALLRSLGRSAVARLRLDARAWLPPLVWARTYTVEAAKADLAAGITVRGAAGAPAAAGEMMCLAAGVARCGFEILYAHASWIEL